MQREFLEMMPYYDTVTRAFERMEAEEFVERIDNRKGRENRYSLTCRGKLVADAFVQVHRHIVKNRDGKDGSDRGFGLNRGNYRVFGKCKGN